MAVITFILRQEEKQRSFNSVFLKIVLGADLSRPELPSLHHHRPLTVLWLQQILLQHLHMYMVVNMQIS